VSRAVFLDRDGVINRKAPEGHYVTCLKEFQFLPEVAKAIRLLNRASFRVVVVSNQRCVAKGLITARTLDLIHRWMCRKLAASGAKLDDVYYCPHDNQPTCKCRKPAPGMLLTAAREHNIDLAASWMIGDSNGDLEAGRSAGCKTARILNHEAVGEGSSDVFAYSLLDATQQILMLETTPGRGLRRQFKFQKPRAAFSS
jgi:D-glycero-D-manno-heptose 1,7-bisphosphate phosphatase